jgi:IMP dehydrogenase
MNVADVMTPREEVVTVSLPGTRDDVLEDLQERAFSSVPVVKGDGDEERYRGLISRQDLIEQPDEDQLALLMREDTPTVERDATLSAAAGVVADTGARRLPVVEGGRLVGIVTVTDLVRAVAESEGTDDRPVDELARRDVNATYAGTPLLVAERELGLAEVPYAVALDDDGSMAGILTEVDVLAVARVVEGEEGTGDSIAGQDEEWRWEGIKAVGNRYLPTRNVEIPAEPVRTFMTDDVESVTGQRTAREAARSMLTHDVEQLPLVSGDALAGIVRDVDLLDVL